MNKLKKWFPIGFIALSLVTSASAAVGGGEVAVIAGATAGAMALPPALAEAMTYSTIDVKIEAYAETLPLARDPKMSVEEWLKLPPNQKRSEAFSLGGPSALYQLIRRTAESQELTPATAMLIAERLAPGITHFDEIAKASANAMNQIEQTGLHQSSLQGVWNDFKVRYEAATNVAAAMTTYRGVVTAGMKDSKLDAVELAQAQQGLQWVRLLLSSFPHQFQTDTADVFSSQTKAIFIDAATRKKPAADPKRPDKKAEADFQNRLGKLVESLSPPKDGSPEERMAAVVAKALARLREVDDNQSKVAVAGAKMELDGSALGRLAGVFSAFGFTAPIEKLKALNGEAAVESSLRLYWLQIAARAEAEQTLTVTYAGVAVGANIGPLVNEAFQGIFSKGKLIDSILEEDKWKPINYAYSRSHAGDHNAIIYFENILTPVLKSATFDPSQFIAANAQLHKRVTGAMADVFGLPLTQAHASTNALPELNLYDIKGRKANADKQAAQHREALLNSLKELIDLHSEVQKQVAAGNWAGADDTAKKATAAKQLQAVQDKLTALMEQLQN